MVLTNKAGRRLSWTNNKLETTEKSAEIYRSIICSLKEFVSAKDLFRISLEIDGEIISVNSIQENYASAFSASLKHLQIESDYQDIAIFLISREELPAQLNPPQFPYGHFEDKNLRFSYNSTNNSLEVSFLIPCTIRPSTADLRATILSFKLCCSLSSSLSRIDRKMPA